MITHEDEADVRSLAADVVLRWQVDHRGPVEDLNEEGYLDLVRAADIGDQESGFALRRWVSAARRNGVSWERIGEALGVSKQAAHKRFGGAEDPMPADGETKTRTGVTAFNEVAILAEEGAAGWEVSGATWLTLYFRYAGQPVHNERVVAARRPTTVIAERAADGWAHAFTWYPYTYFTRAA